MGKNKNKCDYLIKLASSPRSKLRQVHKNRLKYYFNSLPTIKEELNEQSDRQKRKYTKNLKNQEETRGTVKLPSKRMILVASLLQVMKNRMSTQERLNQRGRKKDVK